jgi:hypothetical protein
MDFTGTTRPKGAGFDRGAYEKPTNPGTTVTDVADADTFVRADQPNYNGGADQELQLDVPPYAVPCSSGTASRRASTPPSCGST